MDLLLTFMLVKIPPTCRPVTPSTPYFILMAPHSCKPRHLNDGNSREDPSRATRETIDIVSYHETHVPEEDKVSMSALEYEVCLIDEFKKESKADLQVGRVIPDMGCTRTQKSKLFERLELYWHVKTMVALDILPKYKYFCQLKRRMDMLEIQMEYMSKVNTWLARKHKGVFQPPTSRPRATTVGYGDTTTGPHGGISEDGVGPRKSCAMEPEVPNNF
jgi:hypothetical protein